MSYLDSISVAVSGYVARTNKAIEFFKNHLQDRFTGNDVRYKDKPKMDEMYHRGLFLCLGEGPIDGWDNDTPPLPELETYDIQNPICFKYYSNMYFVKSDVDGKINVGNQTWSKINYDSSIYKDYINNLVNDKDIEDSTKDGFEEIRNNLCRWIYVDFQISSDHSIVNYIRQIGIYSRLKLAENVTPNVNTIYNSSQMATLTTGKRRFDGYLEVIQNKVAFKKDTGQLIFSYILEF